MIRDYKHLIGLQQIHTEQMHLKCAKAKWWYWEILFVKKFVDCTFYGEIVLNNKDNSFQRINY